MQYRYTILFKTKGSEPVGHCERWDFEIANDDAATAFATKLASRRSQFMPLGWQIQSIRVGKVSSFQRVDHTWRFKQIGVHICTPPSQNGSGVAEAIGAAVYYRFNYNPGSGRAAVRLFMPIPEQWTNGSSTGVNAIQAQADGEIQPFARWLIANNHQLYSINKTTGTVTPSTLSCVQFMRSAVKKVGRPFFLRRGRRFAHRTLRP